MVAREEADLLLSSEQDCPCLWPRAEVGVGRPMAIHWHLAGAVDLEVVQLARLVRQGEICMAHATAVMVVLRLTGEWVASHLSAQMAQVVLRALGGRAPGQTVEQEVVVPEG